MSTGEERTYFEDKRNLPQQRIKDTFFDYLEMRLREISQRIWGSERGCFGSCSLISAGNNKFSVSNLPKDFLDGDGNILTLEGSDGEAIGFSNQVPNGSAEYHVGVRHCLVPQGVLRNPRNQVIFYDLLEDRIGEVDEPNSVVESSGSLKVIVDSVFEAGERSDDRLVTVWLRRPVTTDESIAIERNLLVQWDGSNNYVQTTGLLGQAGGAASTDVADYQVCAQGVTVKIHTDLSALHPYAYIGAVYGAGWGNPPGGFSVLGQIDVSDGINPDLQEAYTSGRIITPSAANGGAVRIQSADSGDPMKSLLVLDRKGATEGSPLNLTLVNERGDGVALAVMLPLVETGGALQEDESGDTAVATGVVDLTRVGADLYEAGIHADADFVLLWDFATAAMNRLYKIGTFSAAQVTLLNLDGTVPATWNDGESGNVSFLRAVLASGEELAGDYHDAVSRALTITGGNNVGAPAAMRGYGRNAKAIAEFMSNNGLNVRGSITKHGLIRAAKEEGGGGNTGDPGNRLMELGRFGSVDYGQFMLVAEMGDVSAIPIACLQAVRHGSDLLELETDCETNAGMTLSFNRTGPAVDLTSLQLRLNVGMHLAWITNHEDSGNDGIYLIESISEDSLDLLQLNGADASFTAGTCSARILMPRFSVGNSNVFGALSPMGDFWNGILMTLRDAQGYSADLRILTEGGRIVVYDYGQTDGVDLEDLWPRELLVIDPTKIAADPIDWPTKFKRSVLINGGDVSGGAGQESFHGRDGLRIWNAGGPYEDRDTAFALVVDYGFPEHLPTLHTWPSFCVGTSGGVGRGHHFRDDFIFWPVGSFTTLGPYYTYYPYGAGTAYIRDIWDGAGFGHGAMQLTTGAAADDIAEFGLDGTMFNLDYDYDFRWVYRARLKMSSISGVQVVHGFYRSNVNRRWYFILNYEGDPAGTWRGGWLEDGPTWNVTDPICGITVDKYQFFEIYISQSLVFFTIDRKDHVANSYGSETGTHPTLQGQSGAVGINLWMQTAGGAKSATLDYWEVWDREVLVGRHGTSHNLQHGS